MVTQPTKVDNPILTVRSCDQCGTGLQRRQEWCTACGSRQPATRGVNGLKTAATTVATTVLLGGGACAAAYAALSDKSETGTNVASAADPAPANVTGVPIGELQTTTPTYTTPAKKKKSSKGTYGGTADAGGALPDSSNSNSYDPLVGSSFNAPTGNGATTGTTTTTTPTTTTATASTSKPQNPASVVAPKPDQNLIAGAPVIFPNDNPPLAIGGSDMFADADSGSANSTSRMVDGNGDTPWKPKFSADPARYDPDTGFAFSLQPNPSGDAQAANKITISSSLKGKIHVYGFTDKPKVGSVKDLAKKGVLLGAKPLAAGKDTTLFGLDKDRNNKVHKIKYLVIQITGFAADSKPELDNIKLVMSKLRLRRRLPLVAFSC